MSQLASHVQYCGFLSNQAAGPPDPETFQGASVVFSQPRIAPRTIRTWKSFLTLYQTQNELVFRDVDHHEILRFSLVNLILHSAGRELLFAVPEGGLGGLSAFYVIHKIAFADVEECCSAHSAINTLLDGQRKSRPLSKIWHKLRPRSNTTSHQTHNHDSEPLYDVRTLINADITRSDSLESIDSGCLDTANKATSKYDSGCFDTFKMTSPLASHCQELDAKGCKNMLASLQSIPAATTAIDHGLEDLDQLPTTTVVNTDGEEDEMFGFDPVPSNVRLSSKEQPWLFYDLDWKGCQELLASEPSGLFLIRSQGSDYTLSIKTPQLVSHIPIIKKEGEGFKPSGAATPYFPSLESMVAWLEEDRPRLMGVQLSKPYTVITA